MALRSALSTVSRRVPPSSIARRAIGSTRDKHTVVLLRHGESLCIPRATAAGSCVAVRRPVRLGFGIVEIRISLAVRLPKATSLSPLCVRTWCGGACRFR